MIKKGIEVWPDYDRDGVWCLRIKKKKGYFTLDEIIEACKNYASDFFKWRET